MDGEDRPVWQAWSDAIQMAARDAADLILDAKNEQGERQFAMVIGALVGQQAQSNAAAGAAISKLEARIAELEARN